MSLITILQLTGLQIGDYFIPASGRVSTDMT